MSAAEVVAAMTMKSLRTDENFVLFWTKVEQVVKDLDIEYLSLPWKRKAPKWYDSGSCGSDPPVTVLDCYHLMYFEAIDLICCSIQTRFDQPGFQVYSHLECLLIKAVNKEPRTPVCYQLLRWRYMQGRTKVAHSIP